MGPIERGLPADRSTEASDVLPHGPSDGAVFFNGRTQEATKKEKAPSVDRANRLCWNGVHSHGAAPILLNAFAAKSGAFVHPRR